MLTAVLPLLLCSLSTALAVMVAVPPPGCTRLPQLRGPRRGGRAGRFPARGTPRAARGSRRQARQAQGARPPRALSASEVAALADQLAALAMAGLPAQRSWAAVADHGATPRIRSAGQAVVAGQRRGSTAAAALRAHLVSAPLARPGRRGHLRRAPARAAAQLAVAVDVTEVTGAGTADTLHRFAAALRAEERAAQERDTALAGPRATAAVLGLLPLAGLALGAAIGGRPWHALLWTAPGRVSLVLGGLLWAGGRLWIRLLVRRAAGVG